MPSTYARRHRQYYKTVKWLNARQSDPTKNRALEFFNRVKRFKRYLPRNTLFGSALSSALNQFTLSVPELNTRGFVTDTESKMFNRGAWYDAMYSGLKDPKPGISGNERPGDAQYAAVYRNQRSAFGRKKPYTLKKVKREMRQHDFIMKSRFQVFGNDGFQNGIGGRRLCFRPPGTGGNSPVGMFPFMLFDVTSMPNGAFREPLTGAVQPVMPVRAYQLCFNSSNSKEKEFKRYGWLPVNYLTNSAAHNIQSATFPNPFDDVNVAVTTETTGSPGATTTYPNSDGYSCVHAMGFTHSYSDIKMVMYPQTGLPTKWHVALVSFPDDLVNGLSTKPPFTAGPPLSHMEKVPNDVTQDRFVAKFDPDHCYSVRRTTQNEDFDDLDFRWQAFWSGKLQNPINRDIAGRGTLNPVDKRLPFKIIEHESFLQPPRDSPEFGNSAQRLIKKLFYRRDWSFPPSEMTQGPHRLQGDALANLNTIQTNNVNSSTQGSPFAKPSETVYLAIWCEHFKSDSMESASWDAAAALKSPGVAEFPSFDLVVNMKHILRPENIYVSDGFHPDPPRIFTVLAKGLEPHVEPQPPDEPVKKKRSKKNGILNATSEEGQEGPTPSAS